MNRKGKDRKMKNLNNRTKAFLLSITIFLALWAHTQVHATDLVFRYKSPSFSGIGTSAHYLTIENQEFTRKAEIKSNICLLLHTKLCTENKSCSPSQTYSTYTEEKL